MLKRHVKNICRNINNGNDLRYFPNLGDSQEQVKASSIPKYVVVLDAGHDASHAGAQNRSNGYREEVLTYKIASYCKQELEKHDGVKVYMVRDSYCVPLEAAQ